MLDVGALGTEGPAPSVSAGVITCVSITVGTAAA